MPPFRAAQIVGARFAFFVSLAHVKDRLKQGDGVFESGLGNRYFGFVWACLTLTIVVKTSSSAAAVGKPPSCHVKPQAALTPKGERQFGRLSFFKRAANRGSLCRLFNSGSTFVKIKPSSRLA